MKKVLPLFLILSVMMLTACGVSNSIITEVEKDEILTDENAILEISEKDKVSLGAGTSGSSVNYEITYQNYHLYQDSSGNIRDYVIVQIKNTGATDLYIKSATFSFLDEAGNLAGVDSGLISKDPDVVAPGAYGYIYSNMGSVGGNLDVHANYILIPELTIQESKKAPIPYEISNTSLSAGKFGPVQVIGQITNTTGEDESMVWVAFVFFDKDDNPIAACGTNVMDLAAGSTKSFDGDSTYLSRLDFSVDDVSRYEVYAFKTQYQF